MDDLNIDTTRNNGYYNESEEGIKAASTFDTQATTPCSVISTPPAKKAASSDSCVFQTPDGTSINLGSYEEACLSPTLPVDVDVATAKMKEDKILLDPFVQGLESGPPFQRVFRCLLYLYGRGFYQDKDRLERVKAMLECVKGEALGRLCRVAFSETNDKILCSRGAFVAFVNLHNTARILFDPNSKAFKGFIGGFKGMAILRYQQSRNCYLLCGGVWFSLKCRFDGFGGQEVVDIAWIARHKALHNDELLYDRVVGDRGKSAYSLAKDITNAKHDVQWIHVTWDDDIYNPSLLGGRLMEYLQRYGPGLVCNFKTSDPFRATQSTNDVLEGIGYWRFTGSARTCEGEFVPLDDDGRCEEERNRIEELWKKQANIVKKKTEERKAKMKEIFPADEDQPSSSTPAGSTAGSTVTPTTEQAQRPSGQHAMVLLGGRKVKTGSGEESFEFVLLNWHKMMPLMVVSPEYLQACEVTVRFLKKSLKPSTEGEEGVLEIPCNPSFVSEASGDEGQVPPDQIEMTLGEELEEEEEDYSATTR